MDTVPITFSARNRNFGRSDNADNMRELEGKKAVCITFSKSRLEERATKFIRFRKDPMSQATFKAIDFLISVAMEQEDIEVSKRADAKTSQLIFLLEHLQEEGFMEATGGKKGTQREDLHASLETFSRSSSSASPNTSLKPPPRRGKVPKIVGYRFWMFWDYLDYESDLSDYLELYMVLQRGLKQNEQRMGKDLDKHTSILGEKSKMSRGTRIPDKVGDIEEWKTMLNMIFLGRGEFKSLAVSRGRNAGIQGSPIDPEVAFSAERVFNHTAHMKGVEPAQLDFANYKSGNQYSFPLSSRVFRYTHEQLKDFWKYTIPLPIEQMEQEISRMGDNINNSQVLQYMKEFDVVTETEDGEVKFNRKEYNRFKTYKSESMDNTDMSNTFFDDKADVIREIFKSSFGGAMQNHPEQYDPEFYAKQSILQYKTIMKNYKAKMKAVEDEQWTPEQKQNELAYMLEDYHNKMADQLAQLLDPGFVHMSPYLRKVVEFFEQFRDSHNGSLCHKFMKRSSNLSLFEDFLTTLTRELKTMWDVTNGQFRALVCWFAAMNMSDPIRSNKIIVVNHGAAKTSKSFVTEVVESMCVDGTVLTLSYQTLRSQTARGNYDGCLAVFNEAPEGMMGVNKDKLHGRDSAMAANVNMESTNQWKELSTRGIMVVRTMLIDKDTGNRVEEILKSYRNSSYIFNTNANVFKWDDAVLSRCVLQSFYEHICEGSRPNDLNFRNLSPALKERQEKTREKYKWLHMHIRFVDEAIEKRNICAVNTEFSRTLLRDILERAEELGVPSTDCPRKMATIMAAVRVGVKVRAILLAFGGQLNMKNPTGTEPYEFTDTIMLEGFLVDTDPSILVSVLGIFKFIYEDPLRFYVLRALALKYLLPKEQVAAVKKYDEEHGVKPDKQAAPMPTTYDVPEGVTDEQYNEELYMAADNEEDLERMRRLDRINGELQDMQISDQIDMHAGPRPPSKVKNLKRRKEFRRETPRETMEEGFGTSGGEGGEGGEGDDGMDMGMESSGSRSSTSRSSSSSSTPSGSRVASRSHTPEPGAPILPSEEPSSKAPRKSKTAGRSVSFGPDVVGGEADPLTTREALVAEKERLENETSHLTKEQKQAKRQKEKEEIERRQTASFYTTEEWEESPDWWDKNGRRRMLDHDMFKWQTERNFLYLRLPFCRNKEGHYSHYHPSTIYWMARDLCTIIPTRPTAEHVEEVLSQLFNLPLKIVTTDDGIRRARFTKGFQLEEPYLAIHKDLLLHNSKSKMEQAVKEVVSNHLTEDQTFTFGQNTSSVNFDEFATIHIPAKQHEPGAPFVMRNQEYVSTVMREFDRLNLDDAFSELSLVEKEHFTDQSLPMYQEKRQDIRDRREDALRRRKEAKKKAAILKRKKERAESKRQAMEDQEGDASDEELKSDDEKEEEDEVTMLDMVDPELQSLEQQEKELTDLIEKEQERELARRKTDVTAPSYFHMTYKLAPMVWNRHMAAIGWDRRTIELYNAFPEAKSHQALIQKYNLTRDYMKEQGLRALPSLKPYPENIGFEDRSELERKDLAALRAYAKMHGGEADPMFDNEPRVRPFAERLGFHSDAEFYSLETGVLSKEDELRAKNLIRAEFQEMNRLLTQRRQHEQLDESLVSSSSSYVDVMRPPEEAEDSHYMLENEGPDLDVGSSDFPVGSAIPSSAQSHALDSEMSEAEEVHGSELEDPVSSAVEESSYAPSPVIPPQRSTSSARPAPFHLGGGPLLPPRKGMGRGQVRFGGSHP